MAMYAFGSGRLPHGEVLSSEIDSKDSYILRKPKGVIAIVCPFNFPVAIGSFWCAAPSIVEGNTVVLKPSEDAPMSSQICAEMYHEAGFPKGVFNLIHGEGGAGKFLVQQDVDHICFTGSVWAGRDVRKECARSWHKTSSCEM
jgi:aldehyde dehydrogenase (NAD+)